MASAVENNAKVIDSWKEIAAFLKRGVRTVQRWERTEGLPVRRHQHMKRGSVYVIEAELVSWLRGRQYTLTTQINRGNMSQFDLLHTLTKRQATLARELQRLVVSSADRLTRLNQLKRSRPANVFGVNSSDAASTQSPSDRESA